MIQRNRATCPECGGKRVAVPTSQWMVLALSLFTSAQFTSYACVNCGYVSFYLYDEDIQNLRDSKYNKEK